MITQNDINRFEQCIRTALTKEHELRGIGTLGERTLHVILKDFFEPDRDNQEIKLGRYVADICRDDEIIEIQTRALGAMRKKLAEFTKNHHVNVVYPIADEKYITWINPDSGELTDKRKSPKRGKPWDFLRELYALRPMFPLKNTEFTLVFMNIDEFRLLNGWSADKKKGASRYERIPTALVDMVTLSSPADFALLIPDSLGDRFTAADFRAAAKMTPRCAGYALRTLVSLGVIEHTDTKGKAFIYTRKEF